MSKWKKKMTSFVMAASMVMSMGGIALSASADEAETPDGYDDGYQKDEIVYGSIKFDPGYWDSTKIGFYIYAVSDYSDDKFYASKDGWQTEDTWGKNAIKGFKNDDGVFESYEFDIIVGYDNYVVFYDYDTGSQTYPCVLTVDALGDTAKIVENHLEGPTDDPQHLDEAEFEKTGLSTPLSITSTGEITGKSIPLNMNCAREVAEFVYKSMGEKNKQGEEVVTEELLDKAYEAFHVTSDKVWEEYINFRYSEDDYTAEKEDKARDLIRPLDHDVTYDPVETEENPPYRDPSTYTPDNAEKTPDEPEVYLNDFKYSAYGNGTIAISEYTGNSENVVIPKAIDGKTVEAVGVSAFSGKDFIKRVTIPDTVKHIRESAFAECTSLEHVDFPSGLEKIGKNAFFHCEKLKFTRLPDSVTTIGEFAFANNDSLVYVKLPASLTEIGDDAFNFCETLEFIMIPDTAVNIGSNIVNESTYPVIICNSESKAAKYTEDNNIHYAFLDSESIFMASDLDDGTASITHYFGRDDNNGCLYIPSMIDGKIVSKIDRNLFVQEIETIYDDFADNIARVETQTFVARIYTVILPETLKKIEGDVFANSEVGRIMIPASVEEISDNAFEGIYKGLKIYCYPNTAAETYAKAHDINYVLMEYPEYYTGYEPGNSPYPYPVNETEQLSALGDLDADGAITSGDALAILRFSVGIDEMSDKTLPFADIDGDGTVTAGDALEVLRFSAGLSDNEKINQPV